MNLQKRLRFAFTTAAALAWVVCGAQDLTVTETAAPVQKGSPQRNPNFKAAHEALVKKTKEGQIDVYFEGDSITRRETPQYLP